MWQEEGKDDFQCSEKAHTQSHFAAYVEDFQFFYFMLIYQLQTACSRTVLGVWVLFWDTPAGTNRKKKKRQRKHVIGESEMEWIGPTLWRARLDFSKPKNALSDSGPVALTNIALHIHPALCFSHEGTDNASAGARQSLRESGIQLQGSGTRQKHHLSCSCTSQQHCVWRHFRNFAVPLRPSPQRWLHCKQTRSKENPLLAFHTHTHTKKKLVWVTLKVFFFSPLLLHGFTLFSQAFNFPSFQETFVSVPSSISLQSEQLLFEMRRSSAADFTTYSCSQLATIAWHRTPPSESVITWYLIIYCVAPTYSKLF